MTLRNQVLSLLEQSQGTVISGQELADTLYVSRTAIWKAIQQLRQQGYAIEASSKKGYWLATSSDTLSADAVSSYLTKEGFMLPVEYHETLASTNDRAKQLAFEGAAHGTVVLANAQSAGRGRYGRSFFSPAHTGLYLSLVLRPTTPMEAAHITMSSAVSVCQAIAPWSKQEPHIKWINDIYLGERKLGGILSEAQFGLESGSLDSAVVGIGLNIATAESDFPTELQHKAVSLFSNTIRRSQLAANIIIAVLRNLDQPFQTLLPEYRQRSLLVGRDIIFTLNGQTREGTALEVNDEGHLMVLSNDTTIALHSGEVSIKEFK